MVVGVCYRAGRPVVNPEQLLPDAHTQMRCVKTRLCLSHLLSMVPICPSTQESLSLRQSARAECCTLHPTAIIYSPGLRGYTRCQKSKGRRGSTWEWKRPKVMSGRILVHPKLSRGCHPR